jgi:hypothetical protein
MFTVDEPEMLCDFPHSSTIDIAPRKSIETHLLRSNRSMTVIESNFPEVDEWSRAKSLPLVLYYTQGFR